MKKNKLENLGIYLPKIGIGTALFGMDYANAKELTQNDVSLVLSTAFQKGYKFLDTAREYGRSEKKIGKALSDKNDFLISTKLKKITNQCNLKDVIFESVELSLIELNRQTIDILFLHQTDRYIVDNSLFWETINELKVSNKIRSFGVSTYTPDETEHLIDKYERYIDVFQVPFNLFDQRFLTLKEKIDLNGIAILARSVFLRGIITADLNQIPSTLNELLPELLRVHYIAKQTEMSVAEFALRFVTEHPFVDSALIGIGSNDELLKNISYLDNTQSKIPDFKSELVKDALIDPRQWNF